MYTQYVNLKDFRICINVIMHFRKILEREDELFIVGNILKSLEVSEEKVKIVFYRSFYLYFKNQRNERNYLLQANQRVEEFKAQLKELKVKLKAAEKRAIIAEKTVKIFTKEMDKREGNNHIYIMHIIYHICILYMHFYKF